MHESRLLQAVAQSLADPIFVLDYDGRCLQAVSGDRDGELGCCRYLEGQMLQDVLPTQTAEQILGLIRQAIDEQRIVVTEFPLLSSNCLCFQPDGPQQEQWFEGRLCPVPQRPGEEGLASVVWIVINITRRKELELELRRLATQDELTGLPNRRHFFELFMASLGEFQRYGGYTALAILDLDHFKQVNDDFGHPVGDRVLAHFASVVSRQLRVPDLFARIGGEEFAILLPHTPPDKAHSLLGRIQETLRQAPLVLSPGVEIPVRVSIGLTGFMPQDQSLSDILRRADLLLYQAKDQGRDQICQSHSNH